MIFINIGEILNCIMYSICTFMYVFFYVCLCIYFCMLVYAFIFICMFTYLYLYVCLCMYFSMYVYVYILPAGSCVCYFPGELQGVWETQVTNEGGDGGGGRRGTVPFLTYQSITIHSDVVQEWGRCTDRMDSSVILSDKYVCVCVCVW